METVIASVIIHDGAFVLDVLSVLVGVLSIIVTLLICWQIFNVINFQKEKDNLKEMVETKLDNFQRDNMRDLNNYDDAILELYNKPTNKHRFKIGAFAIDAGSIPHLKHLLDKKQKGESFTEDDIFENWKKNK